MKRFMMQAATFVFAASAICYIGCESSGGVSVAGTVTLDNQPLADAEVVFEPVDRMKGEGGGATAKTDAQGKFTIKSESKKFGLRPGKYNVWVTKFVDKKTGQVPPPEDYEMQKAAGTLTNRVHPRYSDREAGPIFTFDIKGGDDLKIDLQARPKQ